MIATAFLSACAAISGVCAIAHAQHGNPWWFLFSLSAVGYCTFFAVMGAA